MPGQEDTKRLINENSRRLQKLKEQVAEFGPLYAPAHLLTQIEDAEAEIERLQHQAPAGPRQAFEPEMVVIPKGPFFMGSKRSEEIAQGDWPLREVGLEPYAIGKYPVTNEEYSWFVKEHRERQPKAVGWLGIYPPPEKRKHPVVGVTWDDAWAYCEWLTEKVGRRYRLLTEAEWEKAARGDQGCERCYPWGNELTADHCNFKHSETAEVDKYPQGKSPYGCYDMIGNVYEWTCTAWDGDPQEVRYRPEQPNDYLGAHYVCRGGPTQDGARRLGCSVRRPFSPTTRDQLIGFRVAQEMG